MSFTSINLELGNYVQFPRLVLLREPEKSQSTECAICHDCCHYRPEKNDKADSMAVLPPRVLHEESVLMLPDTVRCPDQIPACCPSCRRAAAVKHASRLFSVYHTEIDAANRAFQESKSEDDREKLSAADKKAHRILLSSFNLRAQFDCFQLASKCLSDEDQSGFDRQHKAHFQDGSPSFSQQLSDMSKRLALGETRANLLREPDLARWYGDAIVIARALGLWHAAVRDAARLPRSDEYGTLEQIADKLDRVYKVADLGKIKRRIEILAQRALVRNGAGNNPSRWIKRPADQLPGDGEGNGDGNAPPARFRRTAGGRIAITSNPCSALSDASSTAPLPYQCDTEMDDGIEIQYYEGEEERDGEEAEDEPTPKILSRDCIERPFPFVINNSAGFQDAWETVKVLESRLKGPRGADHDKDLEFMNVLTKELCEYAMEARNEVDVMMAIRTRKLRYLQFCEAHQSEIQKAEDELNRATGQDDRDALGFEEVSERNACLQSLLRFYGEAKGYETEEDTSE
ncbi:hypothetical protein PspLS_04763 [Pyricularia sp. CBS 133598]|nr:hypothetical protein PspLS_04763 [Pyricularia sp. CBS 133598]